MAKYEGEGTPKSLTGRREDTGFSSLQRTFPPSAVSFDNPQQFQSAPATTAYNPPGPSSSGLEGRPGASRMEPSYTIPPSGVLATGPPALPMSTPGFAPQPYTSFTQSGGPGLYAPQLAVGSVSMQEPVVMEAINTHETNTTLDNFPSVSGIQPIPYSSYTGADPPTPPQALSQLDLNATVWNQPSTQPYAYNPPPSSFAFEGQPPGTINTMEPLRSGGVMPAFQSVQPQGSAPNYSVFAPQSSTLPAALPARGSPVLPSQTIMTSGGLRDVPQSSKFSPRQSAVSGGRTLGSTDFPSSQAQMMPSITTMPDTNPPGTKPYTGKILRADESIGSPRNFSQQNVGPSAGFDTRPTVSFDARPSTKTIKPSEEFLAKYEDFAGKPKNTPSMPPSKTLTEKDLGPSVDFKADRKEDESDKENLISQIRERDATIARLLGEVREKRANRLHEIEELADRMDHLEARLLSGHIDPH